MSTCRSCGADIQWARTALGKAIPIETVPPGMLGNLYLEDNGGPTVARVVEPGKGAWISHFATCPHAGQHRKDSTR